MFFVAFVLIAFLVFHWFNNRYEPHVQSKLSSDVDSLYYSGLDDFFDISSTSQSCGGASKWNFLNDRVCFVTRYLRKPVEGTEEEVRSSLTQVQAILEQQGMDMSIPLTIDFNATRGYAISMHMRSRDDACSFSAYLTSHEQKTSDPLRGTVSCRKDIPLKIFL